MGGFLKSPVGNQSSRVGWAMGVIALLVLFSCTDQEPLVSAAEAKESACFHALSLALTAASDDREESLERVARVLEVDARLLEAAGDHIFARAVRDTVADLREGVATATDMSVYLRDSVTEVQIEAIESQLENSEEIASYRFVSAQDAYEEFRDEFADKPELYEDLLPGDLPASFRLRTETGSDPEAIASTLRGLPGVEDARYAGQLTSVINPLLELGETCGLELPD